jgi:hypothetical protein
MQTKIRFDIKFHTNLQIIFLIYLFLLGHAGNVWMTMDKFQAIYKMPKNASHSTECLKLSGIL